MITPKIVTGIFMTALALICVATPALAENIDPDNDGSQWAYGENVGWLNFDPTQGPGVHVTDSKLTGFVWAQNIGWISLSCENTSSCGSVNFGVTNDAAGNLAGWAWGQNVGWISFSCANTTSCATVSYGVTIDSNGIFDGYAWAENIGWISFKLIGQEPYKVKACVVTLEDLLAFVTAWLATGPNLPADLNNSGAVDLLDYQNLAAYWMTFCPDAWTL